MQYSFRRFAIVAAMLGGLGHRAFAQSVITGTLIDRMYGEPIVGATIRISGEQQGAVTDANGNFTLTNPKARRRIEASCLGYKPAEFRVPQSGRMDTLQLLIDDIQLESVIVHGTMAFDRQTPVAMTNVTAQDLEDNLGAQEFGEVLKTTPSVYASKQGGGNGDSEIYMRGFDNTNVATMINGIPMNDMEHGGLYWSNWMGLSDMTRVVQTQRGLGASKVSAPSVGGTINIITKALEQRQGGSLSYTTGSDGFSKVSLALNTGMKNGWGMSLLGVRASGDGYAQGTDFVSYTWFVSVAKRFNAQHTVSFTAFGSPQDHAQRTNNASNSPLTIAEWERVRREYGDHGHRFNPTFGYLNGRAYNGIRNKYHKPQMSLNHDWTINEKSSLSTALYLSIGRGSGTTAAGYGDGSFNDMYGARNGELKTTFRTAQGYFDYDALVARNAQSEEGSLMVYANSVSNHFWTGLLSTYENQLTENLNLSGGVDFRYYDCDHRTEISDLMGGAYFNDYGDRRRVSAANNYRAADPEWANEKLYVGDVVYRNYTSYVVQEGIFGQLEYDNKVVSAYVNGALNNTSYWKRDFLYYDADHEKSDVGHYLGGNIKGGANVNLGRHHNVFVNLGFISRAPKFNGAFMNATTSNYLNEDARNEKVLSLELGYGWRWAWGDVKVNAYLTNWRDKTLTKSLWLDNNTTGYMNMSGADALHKGIEVEAKVSPTTWLDLRGMLSLGDWKWNSTGEGYVYNEQGQAVAQSGELVEAFSAEHAQGKVDLKGIRVGGAPQTTASLGATFKATHDLRFGADWTLYARNYSYYSLSGSNITIGTTTRPQEPWRVPSANVVDLHANYHFTICRGAKHALNAVLIANVNNLFDNQYISKAYSNSTSSEAATADNVYVFYHFGRTYSLRLKLNF